MKVYMLTRIGVAVVMSAVLLGGMTFPISAQQTQSEQKQQKKQDRQQNRQERLSRDQQQERVTQQQQRLIQYREHLDQQRHIGQERQSQLRQQNRMAQYRYQQQYVQRLNRQQVYILNSRNYNYGNDPYYYTPASFRYNRGGSYYETNQYGANLLRQAINQGYSEGFNAGRADRQDRWASNYGDTYAYQDANFGYNGNYVNRDDYNYYFREGFRRGYEDGYNSRHQYGSYSRGNYNILGSVLGAILSFENIR